MTERRKTTQMEKNIQEDKIQPQPQPQPQQEISKKPDRHIETFWLTMKYNMLNFYNKYFEKYQDKIDHIHTLSNTLNQYQKEGHYDKIQLNIENTIQDFALCVIESKDQYMFHIMETNVKRWKKVRIYNVSMTNPLKNSYENSVYLSIDLCKSVIKHIERKEIQEFFENIRGFALNNRYKDILDIAICCDLPSIIIKLRKFIDIADCVAKYYGMEYNDAKILKPKKLLEKLKEYYIENTI